jgi:hypothetical protein
MMGRLFRAHLNVQLGQKKQFPWQLGVPKESRNPDADSQLGRTGIEGERVGSRGIEIAECAKNFSFAS